MKKVVILWILAFLITIAASVYQRVTGLTYLISESIKLTNKDISYKFARANGELEELGMKIKTAISNFFASRLIANRILLH